MAHLMETRKRLQKFPARRLFFDFHQEGDACRFPKRSETHLITRAARSPLQINSECLKPTQVYLQKHFRFVLVACA
jgi:hypothetical protein